MKYIVSYLEHVNIIKFLIFKILSYLFNFFDLNNY